MRKAAQAETGEWALEGSESIICGLELFTHAQAVWLSACLTASVSFLARTPSQTKTHLAISLLLLPPLTFPFLSLALAPSCFFCLCTQTNQSSFDLLEMSLAGEKHSECDEWAEGGGGLLEDALEMQDWWYCGAFSAEEVLSNSRAHS